MNKEERIKRVSELVKHLEMIRELTKGIEEDDEEWILETKSTILEEEKSIHEEVTGGKPEMEASIDVSKPGNVDAKDSKEIPSRANTTSLEEEPLMLEKEQAGKNEPESRIDVSKPGQIETLVAENLQERNLQSKYSKRFMKDGKKEKN